MILKVRVYPDPTLDPGGSGSGSINFIPRGYGYGYMLHYKGLGLELKANVERVIVEIGILAPSDNVLMFEAPGGIKKDHIYSFGIQFAASFRRPKKLFGYMEHAREQFSCYMENFAMKVDVLIQFLDSFSFPQWRTLL
ncbi:hypothetical protein M9H77_21337 [Catharanthus roseus]|uniref:Uncharacterized protein n=1 Tax=Catharanthus roseus TaxID=4058 RepID=A0ACC0AN60_CATRO|nr:hypothetical protein M9H77_21337 [Catharanthus roseus]